MRIAVVLKQVPDLVEELEIDASGKDIDRQWVKLKLNEFDDHALEQAILLKESMLVEVVAVAMDAEGIDQSLYAALARGADRALKLVFEQGVVSDARIGAEAMAGAMRSLAPDLILTGVQAADDLFGQTAPLLASLLDWPHVSVVSGVEATGAAVRVQQEYAGGRMAILEVDLPAVIGVQAAPKPPRYVPISRLRQVMASATIDTQTVALGRGVEGSVVVGMAKPESGVGAEMIEGGPEVVAERIAALLRERGLLRV